MSAPTYAEQLAIGQAFERFVAGRLRPHGFVLESCSFWEAQITIGENVFGLEIKRDGQMRSTGHLYIETEEQSAAGAFVASGIWRLDESWLYGIGDEQEFMIFGKRTLRRIARHLLGHAGWASCRVVETATSRGIVMPIGPARVWAERVFVEQEGRWVVAIQPEHREVAEAEIRWA